MTTTIDLIRHGEPVGGRLYRGQLDHPLSEKGWQQMREAVADYREWQQIVSSPLIRCAAFSQELAEKNKLPIELESDFMEIGFGQWEGQSADELERHNKTAFYAFYDDPINNTPPDAEPLLNFQKRVLVAWQQLLQQHKNKHVLLVAHAGVIRLILSHVLNMPLEAMYRINTPNAGISRISVTESGAKSYPQLIFHAGQL